MKMTRLVFKILALASLLLASSSSLPSALPSTFLFINRSYTGDRFSGKTVVVFGGTSGIGFATAAMLIQECAKDVVVVGQNKKKGALAAEVLLAVTAAHCPDPFRVRFQPANIRVSSEVRAVFASIGVPHAVINTAGIGGWMNVGLGELVDNKDAVGGGRNDAVANNLGGAVVVTQEALRAWNMSSCLPAAGRPCPADVLGKRGGVPALVHLSSVEGMVGCPVCAMYGISKHGIVGMVRSVAASYTLASLRINAVLPGLVDTPLTWNQVRPFARNGTTMLYPTMQPNFQCIDPGTGSLVEDGLCMEGGTGFGCPCPDEQRDDERLPKVFPPAVWPPIDPRTVGATILSLAAGRRAVPKPMASYGAHTVDSGGGGDGDIDPYVNATGLEFTIDNEEQGKVVFKCSSTIEDPIYKTCPTV